MNEAEIMQLCGEAGIRKMVERFYIHMKQDDLIGPMYPEDDWEGSEERLAEFLLFRFGGSTRYTEMRGHPRLRMRHMPFKIGVAERNRWVELMDLAMTEAGIPKEGQVSLNQFFFQVADFMINQSSEA